ncbi:MAG: hypothetical protein R2838_21200 [Caldilineaceae bacterium]
MIEAVLDVEIVSSAGPGAGGLCAVLTPRNWRATGAAEVCLATKDVAFRLHRRHAARRGARPPSTRVQQFIMARFAEQNVDLTIRPSWPWNCFATGPLRCFTAAEHNPIGPGDRCSSTCGK